MDKALRREIIAALIPFMDVNTRNDIINDVFWGEPFQYDIDVTGSNRVFTIRLVDTIFKQYGVLGLNMLLEHIAEYTGHDKKRCFETLMQRLEDATFIRQPLSEFRAIREMLETMRCGSPVRQHEKWQRIIDFLDKGIARHETLFAYMEDTKPPPSPGNE